MHAKRYNLLDEVDVTFKFNTNGHFNKQYASFSDFSCLKIKLLGMNLISTYDVNSWGSAHTHRYNKN